MSRTEVVSVQVCENKWSKLACWAVNPALPDTETLLSVGERGGQENWPSPAK